MRPFEYVRSTDPAEAVATLTADPAADYLAGGTTELDLMLRDGVIAPGRLVDITRLPLKGVTAGDAAVRVGATTTMEELAADPTVAERLPMVCEPCSPARRCSSATWPRSGGTCSSAPAAATSATPPILGASEHCIALHASDLAVAPGPPT
jgi:xanthine dehydrogenase YagS FAD-binding subunit